MKDYTILVPDMLPMHFRLLMKIFGNYGYKMEMLTCHDREVAETGLKYVHNDTCYPAILVIGQFIHALQSGKYDIHKTALILFQTGGGCRASNYVSLLRKALNKADLGFVPVIPLSFAGIEKHPGWKITPSLVHKIAYGVLYGDLLLSLVNQSKPYETEKGASDALAEKWTNELSRQLENVKFVNYSKVKKNYKKILSDFEAIPKVKRNALKVGIVGEIYVKFSSLGNNELCNFLIDEGAEPCLPGLLDFIFYSIYNQMLDYKLYGRGKFVSKIYSFVFSLLRKKQNDIIRIITKNSSFSPPTPILHTISLVDGYIGLGTKMGEGWLLTAEMLELYDNDIKNIICTQPFGCLPNHICGKGMIKPLKESKPDINIVPIDYDAGSSGVNQINRIKLMMANAR